MAEESLENKFDEFSGAVANNTALDRKTTVMIHPAVTMAVGCSQ